MLLCTVIILISSTGNAFQLCIEEEVIILTENSEQKHTDDSELKGGSCEDSIIPNFASAPGILMSNSTSGNSYIGAFSKKYPEVITPPPEV